MRRRTTGPVLLLGILVCLSSGSCGRPAGDTAESKIISETETGQTETGKDDLSQMTEEELQEAVYEKYYKPWTEEEMQRALQDKNQYYRASGYYSEITAYLENVREVRDISNRIEPLYQTDMICYDRADFEGVPMLVIHLAKNEIYARHGYIFRNQDLQNYFMGCLWYSPACESGDFDDAVFNEYEKMNLELLAELDGYQKLQGKTD